MKILFLTVISALLASPASAMEEDYSSLPSQWTPALQKYQDVEFGEGRKFSTTKKDVFIECTVKACSKIVGTYSRLFDIKVEETTVGTIAALYFPLLREVQILLMKVFS